MNDHIFYVCNIGPADPAELFRLTGNSRLSRVNYLASQLYDPNRQLTFDRERFKTALVDKNLTKCIYWIIPSSSKEIWEVIWEVITEESNWLTLFKEVCLTSELFIYNIIHMWCENISLNATKSTSWRVLSDFYEKNRYIGVVPIKKDISTSANNDEHDLPKTLSKSSLLVSESSILMEESKTLLNNASKSFSDGNKVDIPRPVRIRIRKGAVVQDCDVYVGRKCTMGGWNTIRKVAKGNDRWHNPFKGDGAVEKYDLYIRKLIKSDPNMMIDLKSFGGKTLGCFCVNQGTIDNPLCHATIIAKIYSETF